MMKPLADTIKCPECESLLRIDLDTYSKVTVAENKIGRTKDQKEVSAKKSDAEQSMKKPPRDTLDEELSEKSLSQKALDVVKNNKLITAGAVITTACATPIIMGFGSAGIVAGSSAAFIQSCIGNVAAGSAFATMQSLGATGTFVSGTYVGGGIMGTGALNRVANKLWSNNSREPTSNNEDNDNEIDGETNGKTKSPSSEDDDDDRHEDQQDKEEKSSSFQNKSGSATNHSTGEIVCPFCQHRIVLGEHARSPQ